ncbi:MAG: NADAR family protein [Planctomycetes bacterium]|nr:NADAR family protein [Planctomycetota bacterium]
MDIEELRRRAKAGEELEYVFFWGPTHDDHGRMTEHCLSQWYPSPFEVDGIRYATAEHWMMAEKARLFGDAGTLERILADPSPAKAQKLGRTVRCFDAGRWNAHRSEIVVRGNVHKFKQFAPMGEYLRSTRPHVLVEASPLDRIWGIGLDRSAPEARDPRTWRGLNLLGFALMEVRERVFGAVRTA